MFGFGKKNKDRKKKKGTGAQPGRPGREELLAQAKANAAAAREQIGDDTLDKIREAMMKKEGSAFEQARTKVKSMDQERIADNIRAVLDEDRHK